MRLVKLAAVFLVILGVAGAAWYALVGNLTAGERKTYWEQVVGQEIPLGSTKTQIKAWAEKHAVPLDEMKTTNTLYIVVEKVPEKGIACAQWSITVAVTLGNDDRSTQQIIDSDNACF